MRVAYLGSNSGACDLYRAGLPFEYVEAETAFVNTKVALLKEPETDEIKGTNLNCNVLIVPRPMSEIQYQVALGGVRQGLAVVVEIDDELDAIHEKNRAKEMAEGGMPWFYKTLDLAHLITCSSERLKNKYHPDKAVMVPNCVPDQLFDYEPNEEKWGVGWAGSVETHPDDLLEVGDAIARLVNEDGYKFRHIGSGDLTQMIKCNYTAYGLLNYSQYLLGIDSFAAGIVPLETSPFNNSKSWLKGIESAAVGTPFVASPTAEYRRLKKEFGLGVLAKTPHEWYTKLRSLMRDDKRRNELSWRYRETAKDNFRVSKNAWRWDEAWEEAIKRSKHE